MLTDTRSRFRAPGIRMDSRLQRLQQQQAGTGRRQRFTAQVISQEAETPAPPEDRPSENRAKAKEAALQRQVEETTPPSSSSSSDDEDIQALLQKPSRPLLKPVFVPKELRGREVAPSEDVFASRTSEEAGKAKEESRALVADILKREFEAEMAASSNDSLRPDPLSGGFDPSSVDDTDDPAHFEEEFLAWRLRELLRIKEEREERERWDREREEIERIRNMTEEERRKLDEEKQKEWEKAPQTQYKFLQKYYHKGTFFQDEYKEILERDYAQPTGADRSDKDVLPEFMQVRNFGKKGRSKWKHLTAEDTTAFDYGWGAKDNPLNQSKINQMGGMRGDLDNPSKKSKK